LVGVSLGTVSQSYSVGPVTAQQPSTSVGGLAGYLLNTISRSYHVGAVTGGPGSNTGGIVGREDSSDGQNGTISETYHAGVVHGDAGANIGGLVGNKGDVGTIDGPNRSFFDSSVCGCTPGPTGIGDSTSDMYAQVTYAAADWDFTAVWTITDGRSYPHFTWATIAPTVPPASPPATATATPIVLQAQIIQFKPISGRTYGDTQFLVTATGGASASPVTFKATGNCIALGLNSGTITDVNLYSATITVTGAGSCTVTAMQDGNYAYHPARPVSRTFTIAKATPKVSWPNPTAIRAGTPLSKNQLNARATFQGKSLPGTFAYGPKAGTALRAGKQTLHVTFRPSDGADFVAANTSTSLQVR
jgi:hypothetical protein